MVDFPYWDTHQLSSWLELGAAWNEKIKSVNFIPVIMQSVYFMFGKVYEACTCVITKNWKWGINQDF